LKASIFVMFVFVFSCATISTLGAELVVVARVIPVVCVLMIIVTACW